MNNLNFKNLDLKELQKRWKGKSIAIAHIGKEKKLDRLNERLMENKSYLRYIPIVDKDGTPRFYFLIDHQDNIEEFKKSLTSLFNPIRDSDVVVMNDNKYFKNIETYNSVAGRKYKDIGFIFKDTMQGKMVASLQGQEVF